MTLPTESRTKIWNVNEDDPTQSKGIVLHYEPESFSGGVRAAYGGERALAEPRSPMIYGGTDSETFSFTIRYERIPLQSKRKITADEASDIIDKARAFIRSLAAPGIRPAGILGGQTPLVFLEVPGVFTVYCRLESIDWDVTRRNPTSGRIDSLTMRTTWKEDPQYWYSAEELEELGYQRA